MTFTNVRALLGQPRLKKIGLGMLAFVVLTGCQRPKKDAGEPQAAAAAASASGQTASAEKKDAPTGPCADLGKKLCEAAGERSSTCASAQATFNLLSPAACTAGLKDFAVTTEKLKDQRKSCDELVIKLCDGVGQETATCKMVKEKTQEFPPDRCVQMLTQTDSIIADLKKQEMANQPLSQDLQSQIAAANAPSFGPADAKVTVVEFSDFERPYCSKAADVVTQLKEKYGTRVRFVFRQFPLSFHKNAQPAAEASLEAHAQGKFWEYHDVLFKNQRQLDGESLEKYAKEAGLNVNDFKQAMESKKYAEIVKADLKLGENVAVQGTPTMFVNGERVQNPTDVSSVSQLIDAKLGS